MTRLRLVLFVIVLAVTFTGLRAESLAGPYQDPPDKPKTEEKEKPKDEPKVSGPLGSKTNPVRCDYPKGERAYLSRLRCSDSKQPEFSRIGSFGIGPYGNILDGYRVKCEGSDEVKVFMDMYFRDYIEKEAVAGFTIVE